MEKHIDPKPIVPYRILFAAAILSVIAAFTATAAAPRSTGNITAETADTMPRHRLHNDLYRVRISTDNGRRRIKVHALWSPTSPAATATTSTPRVPHAR